jgi:DNA-binding NarL/FixJ family response regulator
MLGDTLVGAVDRHPMMLVGIEACLENATGLALVGTASDAVSAMRMVGRKKPDVLVFDADLPDAPGTELARKVHSVFPDIATLATFEHASLNEPRALLGIGIRGLIASTAGPQALVGAIQSVAAGQTVFPAEALHEPPASGASFTRRELDVLPLVLAGKGNSPIARHLKLSERTVELHLTHIYEKLGVQSRAEAITKLHRLGFAVPVITTPQAAVDLRKSVGQN